MVQARPRGTSDRSAQLLREADQCVARNDHRGAIDLLQSEADAACYPEIARRLVELRVEAFAALDKSAPAQHWPPGYDDCFAGRTAFPEVTPDQLDSSALKAGILGRGALIVRGLMDGALAAGISAEIDAALQARRETALGRADESTREHFYRSPVVRGGPIQFDKDDSNRHTTTGSLWAVDAPLAAARMAGFYRQIGLAGLLQDYFSEPAVLSVRKWVLRCIAPNRGGTAAWHQDGRFLGDPAIRTVNLWIALTDCGAGMTAPGLEIIGGRGGVIHPTGTAGADFDWTVSQNIVDNIVRDEPVQVPTFRAGDAVFFDHFNLHRTAFGAADTQNRYAVESWFFAASTAPARQQPLVF